VKIPKRNCIANQHQQENAGEGDLQAKSDAEITESGEAERQPFGGIHG